MIKKFPLFYIALLYTFSAKDKIVFLMNQFSMICSILTVGLIICIFSIMNGFEQNVSGNIINNYGHLYIRHNAQGNNYLEQANSFNTGFDTLLIHNKNIERIEYKKMQQTMVVINNNQYKMFVMEDSMLNVPIAIPENLDNNIKVINSIDIYDPQSYNPLSQSARHKVYKQYTLLKIKVAEPTIFMSSSEYRKIFRNDNYTFAKIYLQNENLLYSTLNTLKSQLDKSLEIHSWREINPQFISALNIQKKIFFLLYVVLFILLTAIIVSINIAFFKEKRKDWALLKILNISPYSVEKIFLYKSFISILLTCFLGTLLGYLITIYSNDILTFLLAFSGSIYDSNFFFGEESIPHIFEFKDFLYVNVFASFIFFLNFIILLLIFKQETVSKLFKLG